MATMLTLIWWFYGHLLWKQGKREGYFVLI